MGVINTQLISSTALTAGGNIPVGNVVHRNCCNMSAGGTTWNIEGSGFFRIIANITVEPTAVAEMAITLSNNGATIAQAAGTPAVAGDAVNISLVGVVYNRCGCANDSITLTLGSAGTVTERDVVIEKI